VREKISVHTSVPLSRVFSMHDLESVYLMPTRMHDEKLDEEVIHLLGLKDRVDEDSQNKQTAIWDEVCSRILNPKHEVTIGITGKYTAVRDSYASLIRAADDAATSLSAKVKIRWIDTTGVTEENVAEYLADVDGIIVPGGFGTRGAEGKIACIRYARENQLPFLGLCFGFQMAVIEFARNVCGLKDAQSTEIKPKCKNPVIDVLPEQKKIEGLGGNMRLGGRDVQIKPGTLAAKMLRGAETVRLRFRHRYKVDPRYIEPFESAGMVFSGKAPDQPIMQILELPGHPFFVGTQSHPEFTSRTLSPSPFYLGLIAAALGRHVVLGPDET